MVSDGGVFLLNVLIIGGTRFIGPHVARWLIAEGHHVTIFHRGRTNDDLPPGAAFIHGDRHQPADFAKCLTERIAEVVIDVIPLKELDAKELVSVFRGTANRLVVLSSGDVYRNYGRLWGTESGPPDPIPLTEDSALRQRLFPYRSQSQGPGHWMYEYDKILVERTVLENEEVPATVLRLPMVYGPRDHHRTYEYLKRMDDNRPVILLEERKAGFLWTRGYVENVAAAIALAAVHPRAEGRVFNLGEEPPLSEAAWVRRIAKVAGWSGDVLETPANKLPEHLRDSVNWESHLATSTARIREELGYEEPVAWEKGLLRTLAWERGNPPGPDHPARFDYDAEDACLRLAHQARRPSE